MKQAAFFLTVWPEPRSSAAGVRTRELMAILRAEDFEIHAVSPSGPSVYRDELEALGVRTHTCDPNLSSATDAALSTFSPELVIFDRFVMEEQFGWRTRELWPGARAVVDTQDLHSLRRARQRDPSCEPTADQLGDDLLRELSSLHRAGAALVVSSYERELLVTRFGFEPSRVACVPFSATPVSTLASFESRRGFCFLGNFRHPPNLDCVAWILAEHWPKIRALLPDAELYLYGAYPPARISAHKGANGVFARGPVDDHRAALGSHRVLLAPLRFGAGIKGKVMEAWACGTVTAGTAITFEGMGNAGIRAENAESLASLACEAHESKAVWKRESMHALEELRARFSAGIVRDSLLSFLAHAPKEPGLMGRMLRHHSNNSAKYFSRWIEAKNR